MASFYAPLEQGQIRLLHLKPAPSLDHEIVAHLEYSSLEQASFEALSYHWGDASNTLPITLNGTEWPVTVELHSALRNLRPRGLYDAFRVLWVDALCINQQDDVERNTQVAQMADIYRSAKTVLVWLGEATDDSDAMMGWVKKMRASYSIFNVADRDLAQSRYEGLHYALTDSRRSRQLTDFGAGIERALRSIGMSVPGMNSVLQAGVRVLNDIQRAARSQSGSVNALFERPWWTRMWVLQEVLLAKNTIWHCGSSEASFQNLFNFVDNVVGQDLTINEIMLQSGPYTAAILPFLELRDEIEPLHLLSYAWKRDATNPRDKIYSLCGLFRDDRYRVQPRYDWSVEKVYTQYALHIQTLRQDLDIFDFVSNRRNSELSLPSWVPDWSVTEPQSRLYAQHRLSQNHNACGRFKTPLQKIRQGVIRLQGVPIDTVANVGAVFPSGDRSNVAPGPEDPETRQLWTYLQWSALSNIEFDDIAAIFSSQDPHVLRFWWTITRLATIDDDTGNVRPSQNDDPQMRRLLNDWRRWLQQSQNAPEAQVMRFQSHVALCNAGLRFIATQRGYIGTAPPQTLAGDMVYVLAKGKQAYVLRKCQRPIEHGSEGGSSTVPAFKIIGSCYLHGFMSGEAIDSGGVAGHRCDSPHEIDLI
jgi:hypothetical protein